MDIADELGKLHELHDSGALSDEEFVKAKAAVLNGKPPARPKDTEGGSAVHEPADGKNATVADAANRYVNFKIATAIIGPIVGLIIMAIFFFGFFLPQWRESERKREQFREEFDRTWNGFPNEEASGAPAWPNQGVNDNK